MNKTLLVILFPIALSSCGGSKVEIAIDPFQIQYQRVSNWKVFCDVPYKITNYTDNNLKFKANIKTDSGVRLNSRPETFSINHNSNMQGVITSSFRSWDDCNLLYESAKESSSFLIELYNGCPFEGMSDKECAESISIVQSDVGIPVAEAKKREVRPN
ncbi:hypothetical protein [Motilimonas eburnea]|uniref:hypothetical protein n=1 Tax=Motilimonas eburnea TaxID=1737488 RepID=UPI001E631ED5|nr:hypothetical protein [Motilimonas eburnea]MCE2571805.1 hypothetical protein [Motilimonas eburnea]